MGNCIHRCFGVIDRRRRYLRSKYAAEKDFSIEFENLMDEEPPRDEMTRLLTDRERQLLSTRQFDVLIHEQRRVDADVETKLAQQEQEIEREEEEYYEAKREAARIAKLNKDKELASKSNPANRGWVNEDEWEVAGAEDDFENFLASVKARSLATISQVKNGSGDAQSTTSSNAHTKDKSLTEGSSLDMEWDHEAGMSPQRKLAARVSEDSWSKPSTTSPIHSSDLEWDPDFVSADDGERIQLISAASKQAGVSSR
ncbi:AP-1 complex-associated regulatory protein isoform X1 [Aplysia californica]|uniref:AP-1 complex-associated regulatory protein isoform X1 n=1 Tax=Aplysia californica TaxID=6500 RepID=A0ABM0JUK5_APLCA|nr:AP-1 complex-associated regulatory protein isoform X1 [Aplysia californica]